METEILHWNWWRRFLFPTQSISAICFQGSALVRLKTRANHGFLAAPNAKGLQDPRGGGESAPCAPLLGPWQTYAKCKQCWSLPLSLFTRAHHCAAFIRVEMICANKERRPSSTLCCFFSSPNCKWTQPPHLVPAGSVPVPPIRAVLTAGTAPQKWGC